MKSEKVSGVQIYIPESRAKLMEFAFAYKKILVAVNGEKIHYANEQTRAIINRNVGYSDGIAAVWALHKKGYKEAIKIPGCELWLDIIKAYQSEKTFYLVGGKEEVIQKAVTQLRVEFPAINIVGYRNGYLTAQEEEANLIQDISIKKPDVVFVAMGSPKQELLMEKMYGQHAAVYQGLGGSFDVYTGLLDRAPKWWIDNNLEGIYRTLMEPRKRLMRDIRLLPYFYNLLFNKL
ncbi:UDP-N-acetyl-D-mannosaminouronate:lipid I N-acetyl-D-mannosaminouronosyltransferase [Maribacter sedimenticola]|uniref:UDP-N-acetyl-D-mannosaminouronate:lipid I N-acetyl-D-mannosaminouronosyltransferase n=1 Tax=Maribacter sedimenticola TaxID=228956 RepID=A0ABY1SE21_9FLAO|nr:WecB/TagA/CpsF family glycosyltransferase [Maribacter sedimenticola]SNR30113.1 UDP-N-acetyl-D-mannosaminouronate:lipid I N-acetyl-D-mannosaminouronosyltransferase [Maribacter sedimenticola]